jgi:hypothetical protein
LELAMEARRHLPMELLRFPLWNQEGVLCQPLRRDGENHSRIHGHRLHYKQHKKILRKNGTVTILQTTLNNIDQYPAILIKSKQFKPCSLLLRWFL